MRVNVAVETAVSTSTRARQVSAMFDVPVAEKCRLEWDIDLPIEADDWNVGLVVGPSGSGKSTILRHVWGEPPTLDWNAASVVDDFAKTSSMEDIAAACSAVGFNTIPAWMRPHRVLSNGEQFRVDLARRILELPSPVVVDEFTSVVDRQVAQIGSHAVQKYVRKTNKKFVAVGCHYDVIDWLQPDWVLDMATKSFTRRALRRRPDLDVVVGRLPYAAWAMFSPFHYLTANLNRSARCFGLWVQGRLAAFAGMLHMPHPKVRDIVRCSRLVTLPDWQGLGLAMILIEQVASAHRAIGKRVRTYPAHPALIRTFDKSEKWALESMPGFSQTSNTTSKTSTIDSTMGDRSCAVFEYCGPAMDLREAQRLIAA